MTPPSHFAEVVKLLGGGLRDGGWTGEGRPEGGHVLPGATQYDVFKSPLFTTAAPAFLERS